MGPAGAGCKRTGDACSPSPRAHTLTLAQLHKHTVLPFQLVATATTLTRTDITHNYTDGTRNYAYGTRNYIHASQPRSRPHRADNPHCQVFRRFTGQGRWQARARLGPNYPRPQSARRQNQDGAAERLSGPLVVPPSRALRDSGE